MALYLAECAVLALLQVDNGFDVARANLHDDGYTHAAVNLFQLVLEGALSEILHAYIDGCHDVAAVDRRCVSDAEELAEHLLPADDTIGSFEQ